MQILEWKIKEPQMDADKRGFMNTCGLTCRVNFFIFTTCCLSGSIRIHLRFYFRFSHTLRCVLLLLVPPLVLGCSSPRGAGVTRSECVAIAGQYCAHRWMPTTANVLHGIDPDGVVVDTPDSGYQKPGAVPGWWVPGRVNEGIPYQWGGFATPEQFDRDLAMGKAAGDVYTYKKRQLLDAAVSRHATGIDCSGFISRCWRLPRSYSTREFPSICEPLPSWDELRPGDILNTFNSHVCLFIAWQDAARTRMVVCETGVPPYWLAVRRSVAVDELMAKGFAPFRYRGIREG